jgi:hypothetical protein
MAAMTARQRQTHASRNSAAKSALTDHQPVQTLVETARTYARENPEAAALWCFGIGFVLGWKLKLW